MKHIICTVVALFFGLLVMAQSKTKVTWTYAAKKIGDKKYELRLAATIQGGWHLYSQNLDADAIALPTTISFKKNPLITIQGKVKENGKLIAEYDKATQSNSKYYKDKVEFVQLVTLKTKAKTSISGEVEFMVCDDKSCLPPSKVPFTIAIQ
ncbi:MAG TPA: protein-disulfide reductase DsbD domain-containing protein [Chitinophagaceae bacterium]|nr:protein-disulfide reductase DsbD domain-containing protein [Chitinophagaceae bacterium]